MGFSQRKTERRRQRCKQKKREARVFALRRERHLSDHSHPLYSCVVNRDWRKCGEASILLARTVSPTSVTLAAFLVDLWAMGLKDAWGRTDLPVSEFDDSVRRMDERLGTRALKIESARDIVYGGIQLARDSGFRLPRKHECWAAVLGPLPDGESPDMSLFSPGGPLVIV